jgi:hypothetical protein
MATEGTSIARRAEQRRRIAERCQGKSAVCCWSATTASRPSIQACRLSRSIPSRNGTHRRACIAARSPTMSADRDPECSAGDQERPALLALEQWLGSGAQPPEREQGEHWSDHQQADGPRCHRSPSTAVTPSSANAGSGTNPSAIRIRAQRPQHEPRPNTSTIRQRHRRAQLHDVDHAAAQAQVAAGRRREAKHAAQRREAQQREHRRPLAVLRAARITISAATRRRPGCRRSARRRNGRRPIAR